VVPRAQAQRRQRARQVGHDIVEVEGPAIGEQALQDLGANAEHERADDEREVEGAAPRGVEDPVEGGGQDEEGDAVQDLVVDHGVDLDGGQPGVACDCEQGEEGSWRGERKTLAGRAGRGWTGGERRTGEGQPYAHSGSRSNWYLNQ